MKTVKRKLSSFPVLLLFYLCADRCESLTDSSLPEIFYPFGTDQGDSVVTIGDDNCDGPIDIPYEIFNNRTLYVSSETEEYDVSLFLCCVFDRGSTAFITHCAQFLDFGHLSIFSLLTNFAQQIPCVQKVFI